MLLRASSADADPADDQPWSFVIISVGVSSMTTGVLNLILANWIFGGVALGVGSASIERAPS